jgi:hypothetical protein
MRYKRILQYMKENGGCRVWDWHPSHIEAKLVALLLEEARIQEGKKSRRRAKNSSSHWAEGRPGVEISMGHGSSTSGLAYPHPLHLTTQNLQDDFRQSYSGNTYPTPLTPRQRDEVADEIYRLRGAPTSPMSVDEVNGDDDLLSNDSQPEGPSDNDFDNNHSQRMARQACSQILEAGSER